MEINLIIAAIGVLNGVISNTSVADDVKLAAQTKMKELIGLLPSVAGQA